MKSRLLEQIRDKHLQNLKPGQVLEKTKYYQMDLIGKLRTKYYTLRESKDPEQRAIASTYMDEKINIFFYILSNNKRKLTDKELTYLTDFFCKCFPG